VDLRSITPVVLTRDEEPNIARTLAALTWALEVVVVDSFSVDATVQLATRFANVRVVQRQMDTLAAQTNYGLEQVRSRWVLLLDADYLVSERLVEELRALAPDPATVAYRAPFVYAIDGRPLRATLYPPRVVLFDRERAQAWQDGHAHRVAVDGVIGDLRSSIVHDDRKSFANFVRRQRRYMRQEADKIRAAAFREVNWAGRVRKLIVVAPPAVVIHTLLLRGLLLDGRAGLWYAWERFVAETLLSWELLRGLGRGERGKGSAEP
jgi:glycosyltransferase involved in cell wall biosynthesis